MISASVWLFTRSPPERYEDWLMWLLRSLFVDRPRQISFYPVLDIGPALNSFLPNPSTGGPEALCLFSYFKGVKYPNFIFLLCVNYRNSPTFLSGRSTTSSLGKSLPFCVASKGGDSGGRAPFDTQMTRAAAQALKSQAQGRETR
jgi:hypothetical protein